MHLHPNEIPVCIQGSNIPVGYALHTENFSFMAIYDTDGTVNSYVESGPDEPSQMAHHRSMAEAKRHLDKFLQSSGR